MERMVLPWPPNNGTTRSAVVNADGNFFSNPDAGYQPWGIVPERTVPYRPTPVAPTAQTSLNKSRTGGRRPWHIAGPARPGHHTQQRASITLFLLTKIGTTSSMSFSTIPPTAHGPAIAPGTLKSPKGIVSL